jgi:hypothetical protein
MLVTLSELGVYGSIGQSLTDGLLLIIAYSLKVTRGGRVTSAVAGPTPTRLSMQAAAVVAPRQPYVPVPRQFAAVQGRLHCIALAGLCVRRLASLH